MNAHSHPICPCHDAPGIASQRAVREEDATRFAMIRALHRGFYDQHRERYGTSFTAWEEPLPQLTWSRQSVEKVKGWIEAGGFPWEVAAAERKKGRMTGGPEQEDEG